MSEDMKVDELLPLVTEVVSAQLSNNKTASSAVGPLIQSVYQVLDELRIKERRLSYRSQLCQQRNLLHPTTSSAWKTASS
jgi:predicted transcriptional regulator